MQLTDFEGKYLLNLILNGPVRPARQVLNDLSDAVLTAPRRSQSAQK